MQVKSSLFFLCLANWTQFCVIKTSNPSLNAGIMAHDSVLCFLMKFASSAQICYSYIISIRIPPWYYSLMFSKCLKNHLFRHFLLLYLNCLKYNIYFLTFSHNPFFLQIKHVRSLHAIEPGRSSSGL